MQIMCYIQGKLFASVPRPYCVSIHFQNYSLIRVDAPTKKKVSFKECQADSRKWQ